MSIDSTHDGIQNDRRVFLYRLVGAGVAVASTNLLAGCAMGTSAIAGAQSPAPHESYDDRWISRLGKYRTAYDSPEIQSGAALDYAASAMQGYREALGTNDTGFTPVLILRHNASAMTLSDAMWDRVALGEYSKLKDPTTGETTKRNPFIRFNKDDKHSMVDEDTALDVLMTRGVIVMACNNALKGVAGMLRKKEPQFTAVTALQEVHRHVLPGVFVMPNGIFAVSATQDAGCHYMRVMV
jgi:intracellular sulfur oxidation DsrE/DsrF family protein